MITEILSLILLSGLSKRSYGFAVLISTYWEHSCNKRIQWILLLELVQKRTPARKAYSMQCQCCYVRAAWFPSLPFSHAYSTLVPMHLHSTGQHMILQWGQFSSFLLAHSFTRQKLQKLKHIVLKWGVRQTLPKNDWNASSLLLL